MNQSSSQPSRQKQSDPEVELLLNDACSAPLVPRTLLKRLDQAIELEWGTSPRLADTRITRVGRSLSHGARWLKTLPIAAGLSVLIFAALFLLPQSVTCTWADVVEALQQQPLVQLTDPARNDAQRWMNASAGIVAVETSVNCELLNLNDGFTLTRQAGAPVIQRQKLNFKGNSQEKALLGLLLEQSNPIPEGFLEHAVVAAERCETVNTDGGKQFRLTVEVASPGHRDISLSLLVDPNSRLPQSCDVTNVNDEARVEHFAFSYPKETYTVRMARTFPNELPVQDLDVEIMVAAVPTAQPNGVDSTVTADVAPSKLPSPEVVVSEVDLNKPDADALAESDQMKKDKVPEVRVPTLLDPPNEWLPVTVRARSRQQAIQDINQTLEQLWRQHDVQPAQAASDEELLRRVYLDLAGRTPSVVEVRQYLADTSADRFEKLIDRLLNSVDHASHLATSFRTFLIPEGVDLSNFGGVEAFDKWLADQLQKQTPYDEIVESLLLAEGRLSHSGPLLFYSAARLDADQLAARTARVFLGMRLECAQCHDHPFEAWTQQDFWGFAAFFARISRPKGTLESASRVMQVRDVDRGDVMLPNTTDAVAPRFLGAEDSITDIAPDARRKTLTAWLTAGDNPYFARATVNRVWGQMFGKGIVDPMDDLGIEHPPKSPELMDLLASVLIDNNFRLHEVFRIVALSDAYQLSSGADSSSGDDDERLEWFAQMNVKTLTAEQVYDCISVATLLSNEQPADPFSFNVLRFGNSARDQFLQQFKTPVGRPTEYQGGIPQALTLMNGTLIDGATGLSSSGLLSSLEAPFFTNRQRIEVLYFATLSRQPSKSEWELLNAYLPEDASGPQLREALSDILWALLNSAEFTVNH